MRLGVKKAGLTSIEGRLNWLPPSPHRFPPLYKYFPPSQKSSNLFPGCDFPVYKRYNLAS